jgi:hypothetical protein
MNELGAAIGVMLLGGLGFLVGYMIRAYIEDRR